jgi:DNA polymerase I
MIVSRTQVDEALSEIKGEFLSLDTETTGLMLWKEDRLFSVILGTEEKSYYFNFWGEPAHDGSIPPEEFILPQKETLTKIEAVLHNRCIFMHNAKFDLCALAKEGINVSSTIHDTEVGARLERNEHLSYSLDDCAKRIGLEKSSEVESYIEKHKLWEWKAVPGKKTRIKNKFFHKVPFDIISAYGEKDAEVTYKLGIHQISSIKSFDDENSKDRSPLSAALTMERAVTPVAFQMEKAGIKVDLPYCDEAIAFEDARSLATVKEFKKLTGFEFKDSGKHLSQVFSALGFEVPQTEKGNPSFTDEILEGFKNPVADLLREYRDSQKRANTYFRSFKFYADNIGILHTNLRQAGTETGRFSCTNPNLQNLSRNSDKDLKYPIRRAFIPREDFIYVMIDYNQMEFRMMLDYARQMDLIEAIMNGHDPHQASADLTGLSRYEAKTFNFMLLYGGGAQKIADMLGISLSEAKQLKYRYFANLPRVKAFLKQAARKAEMQGFVRDWNGRVFYFKDPNFSYKAPNAIIQGGCSSVVKLAMPRLGKYLKDKKSQMLMQIHDELLLEVHKKEFGIIDDLKEIMETVYPHKHIPLTCSVSHSLKSWEDKVEGPPDSAKGNEIQNQSQKRSERIIGDGVSAMVH